MATLRIPSTAWLYLHRPGQVEVVPVGLVIRFEPHPIWDEWLWLTLESPTGHVVFDVSRADEAALDGAERHVPSGCERIDWDREWRHLGVAS